MKVITQLKFEIGLIIFLYAGMIWALCWTIFFYEPKIEEKPEPKQTVVEIVESPAGFDVYVKDSLVFEFTQQNCDSNSLETLEMLFHAEKELRSQNK